MTPESDGGGRAREIARQLGLGVAGVPRRRRVVLGAGAALALALVVGLFFLGGDDESYRYVTEPARRGELIATVTATGTLKPTNQVDVSSELSGTIRSVEVDFNDEVKVGQVIARLDTTRLDAQVLQSEAAVTAAQARVEQVRATLVEADAQLARLERAHEMSGGKVPSRQELDAGRAIRARAVADLASAKASVAQAKATLDAQRTDLGKSVIRSPINGVVLLRSAEPGQTVAASLQAPVLFTLAEDLTTMELSVAVDEADVGRVAEGQEASFTVDAWPDRVFHARVAQVRFGATTALEGVGVVTYETVLEVDNAERLLRPGMTATAEITVQRIADALLVPNGALRFTPPREAQADSGGVLRALTGGGPPRRGNQVRTRTENGAAQRAQRVYRLRGAKLEEVPVAVGASDGTWTEVESDAIEPGAELVIDAIAKPS